MAKHLSPTLDPKRLEIELREQYEDGSEMTKGGVRRFVTQWCEEVYEWRDAEGKLTAYSTTMHPPLVRYRGELYGRTEDYTADAEGKFLTVRIYIKLPDVTVDG